MFISINTEKHFLIIGLLVVLLSSCSKESESTQTTHFSVLGDSFSTFENHVTPTSNDIWPYYGNIGVTSAEQMWWAQVAESMGWVLEYNNSFSGSLICNVNFDNYFEPYSFLNRMDNLGNPDVILVFGGNNDIAVDIPVGEYIYNDWTNEELCTFRPALACLFYNLRTLYPESKIFFMADVTVLDYFMDPVHKITNYYGIKCIDLYRIEKDWGHPNANGMTDIAIQVVTALRTTETMEQNW